MSIDHRLLTGHDPPLANTAARTFRRRFYPDTVEKIAAQLCQLSCVKIDLLHRPTDRSRTLVKGTRTPENLTTETASDFFNGIREESDVQGRPSRWH